MELKPWNGTDVDKFFLFSSTKNLIHSSIFLVFVRIKQATKDKAETQSLIRCTCCCCTVTPASVNTPEMKILNIWSEL
jgi:hypothetical protein